MNTNRNLQCWRPYKVLCLDFCVMSRVWQDSLCTLCLTVLVLQYGQGSAELPHVNSIVWWEFLFKAWMIVKGNNPLILYFLAIISLIWLEKEPRIFLDMKMSVEALGSMFCSLWQVLVKKEFSGASLEKYHALLVYIMQCVLMGNGCPCCTYGGGGSSNVKVCKLKKAIYDLK